VAYHGGEIERTCPWGGCTVATLATLPLCHDWTAIVGLSPHVFFPINTKKERAEKGEERKKRQKPRRRREGK